MKKLLLIIILISSSINSQNITLDNTFGTSGITTLNRVNTRGSVMKLQSDGKILILGFVETSSTIFITRLNIDGSLDLNFGNNGFFETNSNEDFVSINILSNDKILIGLSSPTKIIKLNSNGSLDTSFGTNGEVDLSSLIISSDLRTVLVEPDNSILAIGYDQIVKVLSNGTIDTSFGVNGNIDTPISNSIYSNDNKLLSIISAGSGGSSGLYKLIKKEINGNLITSFGTNGEVSITDLDNNDTGFKIFTDSNGKIIVITSRETQLRITRYLANGQIDLSFAQNGNIIDNNNPPRLLDFKVNGTKLLFTGVSNTTQSPLNLYIAQYNENGTIDTSFNSNGIYLEDTNTANEYADNIYLLNNGDILVSGGYLNENENYFVARYINTTLSVNGINDRNQISFKNPSENELNIYSKKTIQTLMLFNSNGKIIRTSKGDFMDLSFINDGIYFIKIVFNDNQIIRSKLIIKK